MARLSSALIGIGLLVMTLGALWQLGLVPGSRVSVPEPVALAPTLALKTAVPGAEATSPVSAPTPDARLATPEPVRPTPIPRTQPTPVSRRMPPVSADAADRALARPIPTPAPETGYAVRLAIAAIGLDTPVEQGRVVEDADGNAVWETLPFVAVHYGDLTALIGAQGNAVIAGHVVTRTEGNVFRELYRVNPDDQVQVWDDADREHEFRVLDVKLVSPSDTWVMAPTADETLTLITCGGSFDPIKREFSHRLVVTAKPAKS